MKPADLYRLPSEGRMGFRSALLQALVLYLLGLAILSGFLTQRFAHALGYHSYLGPALLPEPTVDSRLLLAAALVLGLGAVALLAIRPVAALPAFAATGIPLALAFGPLYVPTHYLLWAWRYREVAAYGSEFRTGLALLAGGAVLGLVPVGVASYRAARRLRLKADIHGSARWATEKDVRESGLLDAKEGLLLGLWPGRFGPRYLRHDGPEHALVFAPTRSGKGVGLVVPNLLTWPGSVIVHDIKGENWALSAGWRSQELGSVCIRFDPTDTSGNAAPYNPLSEIRRGAHEVRDAQTIADILVDPNGDRIRDHWDRTAHELLTGLILHVLYSGREPTLKSCADFLTDPGRAVEASLKEMLRFQHDPDCREGWRDAGGQPTPTHPVVAATARAVLDKSGNERSGVLSTALSFLALYRDPIVAANTSRSAFRIRDLMNHDRPVSLYLTVPSSDLSRTRPLVRMLLNQICRRLTEELRFKDGRPVPHYRFPLLMMLDEFPALGRLSFFAESLAFLAGYGIRVFLIAQDLSQIYGLYGRNESITGNCHIRIAFAPNKPETAELVSKMAGLTTVHQERATFRGDRFDLVMNKQYRTQVESQRQLLTADEAMRLPDEEQLLFLAGRRPIRAGKIEYYDDSHLASRAAIAAPDSSQPVPRSRNR